MAIEWTLDSLTFEVDLFATLWTTQLQVFEFPCPVPIAIEVNALSLDWNRWDRIYLFPPTTVLSEVVEILLSFRGQGILIAPYWPEAPWFPFLLEMDPDPVPLPEDFFMWKETSRRVTRHDDSMFQPSRMEAKRAGLPRMGLSGATANLVLNCHRPNTLGQYL